MRIPAIYDGALNFRDGVAPVKTGGKWGFIDNQGRVLCPPQFNEIRRARAGMAAVRIKFQWGYVNTDGELISDVYFDYVLDFADGFGCVANANPLG